ncbi:unnamed protein product [Soboliphyme baturini]|uniref:Aha1_N domain-containing protein n=1 Tax=Soboliphyme baturini TaxID=241478 RepID=A0A183IWL4_9BILA|nr:unnamed protein product [Soboliphyme baturini]
MAKWGEGDPRWIVEERPDATNVNNWHWTEKNATSWSQSKLKQLLEDLEVKGSEGTCKIVQLTKIEGEAYANNRKGKLIFFYEWCIKCDWEGVVPGNGKTYKGEIEIPNLSDENGINDIDIEVSSENNDENVVQLLDMMRNQGSELIRAKISEYLTQLTQEYAKGLILPTKKNVTPNLRLKEVKKGEPATGTFTKEIILNEDQQKVATPKETHISTQSLKLKEEFKCSAADLYTALTDPNMVCAFTRGPVQMEPTVGGKFVLFNGIVEGQFLEMIPGSRLKMLWRMNSWPSDHFSTVEVELNQKTDCTELVVDQAGIPVTHITNTEDGWRQHYFESMKQTFGFGAQLL